MTEDPSTKNPIETSEPEKSAADSASETLIKLAEAGLHPSPENKKKLLTLLGVPEPAIIEVLAKDTQKSLLAVTDEPLKPRVEAAIQAALEKNIKPQTRVGNDIFRQHGISLNDMEAGKIVKASLDESIERHDDFLIIAQKVTLLHDFPDEVGGGGFNRMSQVPETRKKLLQRLLEELPKYDDALKDRSFSYIFNRAAGVWQEIDIQKVGFSNLTGNQLANAIIDFVLKKLEAQS